MLCCSGMSSMNGSCLQQREAHAAHAAHAPQLSSHVSSYPYMFHHDPLHPLGGAAYNPRAPTMAHQSHQAHHAGYGAAHSSVPTSTGELSSSLTCTNHLGK